MVAPDPVSPERLAHDALAALERGDHAGARDCLDRIPPDAPAPWTLIGQVEHALGDDVRADRALTRQLGRAPRDLVALLLLGDIRARRGEDRQATGFYRTALAVADGANVAPELHPLLNAARTFVAQAQGRFAGHLEQAVSMAGLDAGRGGARLRASVDLLFGRSEIFLQQPSMFYLPGLPQRAFYERDEFAWLPAIEAAIPAMKRELEALMADTNGFAPYVQRTPDQPPPANPLLDDPSWSAQYLWRNGERMPPAATRCPATMAALALAPIPVIARRSPMALFSLLRPGTHIRPHNGLLNTRLICHIPLLAPPGCAIRVGAETREWVEGEALIFDDSIEHEAWNRGSQTRVVLLFEIWRPEVTPAERIALTGIFEAIDTYRGAPIDTG